MACQVARLHSDPNLCERASHDEGEVLGVIERKHGKNPGLIRIEWQLQE